MSKINFEEYFEIYLFNYPNKTESSTKLGEFLSFLKFHKASLPYKFSFVAREASLIPEMTLNQNLLIDFSPNSLTESKEVQFQDFLKLPENVAFEKLYKTMELPHVFPEESDAQMKKVCSLIKALLCEGQFIFLEEPEIDLSPMTLSLFIIALKEHVRQHQVNVFIYSQNLSLWSPHSQKMVERNKDFSFQVAQVAKNYLWIEERDKFYAKTEEEKNFEGLKFTHPAQKKRKNKAA